MLKDLHEDTAKMLLRVVARLRSIPDDLIEDAGRFAKMRGLFVAILKRHRLISLSALSLPHFYLRFGLRVSARRTKIPCHWRSWGGFQSCPYLSASAARLTPRAPARRAQVRRSLGSAFNPRPPASARP